MKVVVDRSKCVSLGICEGLAPEIFVLNDEGELEVDDQADVDPADIELVRSAVSGCPVSALSVADD
ncbi:ferredoxin [Nocardioides sp. NPDC051685]|uniref:ferredoxin n=1 Tax=Nocardioides sp. NPDC051685 TaxID=3364334 RepID=UPI0037A71EE2